MHTDPDYSCVYIVMSTSDSTLKGYGLTFTCGKGTEVVLQAALAFRPFVINHTLSAIVSDFGKFWHDLANQSQLRWIGPECGASHLAMAAIINAIWDIWARVEKKPLWKLLADMSPEDLVKTIDFTYITDFLTPQEAIEILKKGNEKKQERENEILKSGYPAYTTSAGWLGYTDTQIKELCEAAMKQGIKRFKMKVGSNLEDDKRRAKILRDVIGYDNPLMTDANQRWTVSEAIDWMKAMAEFKPYWIEEPTSPFDILGHRDISVALKPYNILVATGEACANRVLFKQFLTSGGMQICQIDSCRMGGVNEVISVILMAKKANVVVCPHAGGVGLCEYVQHLAIFDYLSVSCDLKGRMCEYSDHLHEHFKQPAKLNNGSYVAPLAPGYSVEMLEESVRDHIFPTGSIWENLLKK